jgi:hypothetical protein
VRQPKDRNGRTIGIGTRVRLLNLSGAWFDQLPPDEKSDVESMIGEVFRVYDIDEYGQAWVSKEWTDEAEDGIMSHSVAPSSEEIQIVEE